VELNDKHISIYDRSVPIDYKHATIEYEVKNNKNEVKPLKPKTSLLEDDNEDNAEISNDEGKTIVEEMNVHYETTKEYKSIPKVDRGDNDWYKHAGIVMQKMEKEYPESSPYLYFLLISHMIESLLFDDKLSVMNYIYSLQSIREDSIERYIKDYFEKHSITTKDFTVFIAYKLDKRVILVLDGNIWKDITTSNIVDSREVASSIVTKQFLAFDRSHYHSIVGFMGYEKGNANIVFKTKNMDSKRDTGATCEDAGKAKNIARLNEIVGQDIYTAQNTKPVSNFELCIIKEFILRYFNEIRKDNKHKRWFLMPELPIYHKFYQV